MLGKAQDVVEELACGDGAIASLAVVGAWHRVSDHAHDNGYLQLHVLGGFQDDGDAGQAVVDRPAAVFFPPGSAHAFDVGPAGLATVVIEFESTSLARLLDGAPAGRLRHWVGGPVGACASRLARLWLANAEDPRLFATTNAFLRAAVMAPPPRRPPPAWLDQVDAIVDADNGGLRLDALASRVGLTGPWLTRAYRFWRGEGLGDYRCRRRVEAATLLLETATAGLAEVAVQAGFCDQSHMTRAFRRYLGRTPASVRSAPFGLSAHRS